MWNTPTITETTKEVDESFQTAQRYLNQGLVPLVTLMKLLQHDKEEEFKLKKDAFQLLAYAHWDVVGAVNYTNSISYNAENYSK